MPSAIEDIQRGITQAGAQLAEGGLGKEVELSAARDEAVKAVTAAQATGAADPLGTFTTLTLAVEPQLKPLLNIPDGWAVAALMPMGKPVKQLTRLKRKPVEEIAVLGSWDGAALQK